MRRLVYDLRTEGSGPGREAAAIAAGVFIGCLPFYGFHLIICVVVGWLFRLNRLKLYLAANISNPFVAPWLLFAELQTGSWLRRGHVHEISLDTLRTTGVAGLGADLLIGSVVVGAVLAALAGWGTYATMRGAAGDRPFVDLVRRASDRYVEMSITAWEFARGKLRHDPVYRASVCDRLLAPARGDGQAGGTLVDVGCGQGLMLALLAEVRRAVRAGGWPEDAAPCFDRMVGVELRPRVAAIARAALGADAEIVTGDALASQVPRADVVLLFDVLHLMAAGEQERLLASLASSLEPGGVMIIREADAAAGWRFTAVRLGNRLKAMVIGRWRQPFHFRSTGGWHTCLAALGLEADTRPMGQGTPFGNVLFRVSVPARAPQAAVPAASRAGGGHPGDDRSR
jgi:uncharacterized protein (DUF2062 family)/2-polyprenyl-3-methyl-5-hydroxy-6-metoxy-1,4-benzoquinol methylase